MPYSTRKQALYFWIVRFKHANDCCWFCKVFAGKASRAPTRFALRRRKRFACVEVETYALNDPLGAPVYLGISYLD